MEWVRNCKGRFNSMIVRLKGLPAPYTPPAYTGCFNSMIVRLKVYGFDGFFYTCRVFQFYDSPIKSIAARAVIADTTVSIL